MQIRAVGHALYPDVCARARCSQSNPEESLCPSSTHLLLENARVLRPSPSAGSGMVHACKLMEIELYAMRFARVGERGACLTFILLCGAQSRLLLPRHLNQVRAGERRAGPALADDVVVTKAQLAFIVLSVRPPPFPKTNRIRNPGSSISNPNFVDFFIQVENVFAGTPQGAEEDENKFTKIMDEVSGWTFGPGIKLNTDEPPP
jgi:hypothetical protein